MSPAIIAIFFNRGSPTNGAHETAYKAVAFWLWYSTREKAISHADLYAKCTSRFLYTLRLKKSRFLTFLDCWKAYEI